MWGILMLLTLGLIFPWREAALERYKMRHCHYGDLQGHFEGNGWEFFKRAWGIWFFFMASFIVLLVIGPLAKYFPTLIPISVVFGIFALFIPIAAPFLYALFKAIEWRWWLSGIRFGDVHLESTLSDGALMGLYWKVIGWFVLIVALFLGYLCLAVALIASFRNAAMANLLTSPDLQRSFPILALTAVGYLTFVLALNVVLRVYLLRDVWARVVGSMTVHHLEAAENVLARGDLANALGEGFADGLDVVGF